MRVLAEAVSVILTAERDPREVFKEVRAMRELIAQEKGDGDPWDMKLARGGLTDLDFLAQGLVLAYANAHPSLAGLSTEATFAQARARGLLSSDDARTLTEARKLFNDILQWQRLTIEGRFEADKVPPVILKRLATVSGLPSAKVLLEHLGEIRRRVWTACGTLS